MQFPIQGFTVHFQNTREFRVINPYINLVIFMRFPDFIMVFLIYSKKLDLQFFELVSRYAIIMKSAVVIESVNPF